MTTSLRRFAALPLVALLVVTAACSDLSTAPQADLAGPAFAKAPGTDNASRVVSQTVKGDTTITVFVVGTNANQSASFQLGNDSKIDFPLAAGSICNIATSSYGVGTWDDACTPSTTSVTITAKAWVNSAGLAESNFEPAMRFVPNTKKSVRITLKGSATGMGRIDFRNAAGVVVNEALTDASLITQTDPLNGKVYRIIKHFSGYTVTAD